MAPERKLRLMLLAAVPVSLLACRLLFSLPGVGVIEWRLADYWAVSSKGREQVSPVAVVGVDEALFERDGFDWPLEKQVYGDLIDYLDEMGARVIVFDILFADDLYACGREDDVFIGMLQAVPRVVLGYGLVVDEAGADGSGGMLRPVPERFGAGAGRVDAFTVRGAVLPYDSLLAVTAHAGFLNRARPMADGIERQAQLFLSQDSLLLPSMDLAAVALYDSATAIEWDRKSGRAVVAGRRIPLDRSARMTIDFSRTVPVYPLSDVRRSHRMFLEGGQPAIGRRQFENRIVYVGNTAESLGDFGITPQSVGSREGRSPNVLTHALAAATMLDNRAVRTGGPLAGMAVTLACMAAVCLAFCFGPAWAGFAAAPAAAAALYLASSRLFAGGLFLPPLETLAGLLLQALLSGLAVYADRDSDRRFLYQTFRTYLAPGVIEEMHRRKIRPQLGGEEVFATSFFTDIEGFSSLSEKLPPAAMVARLNEYFSRMTTVLLECHGTLDKFIGDAIVAFFGAPRPSDRHASDACLAAVRMQEALAALRADWEGRSDVPEGIRGMKMRIGINSGRFVTGNIGCELRMNYTMMGDAVNVAARLEGSCKQYGVYTVCGEDTHALVKGEFLMRRLDRIRVIGRSRPVAIYQIMGVPRADDDRLLSLIRTYEEALERYFGGDFSAAAEGFRRSLELEKFGDAKNPSAVMIDRCDHLARIRPEQWDGTFGMKEK